MTLEDRLERLANRTPPGDPGEVMSAAHACAQAGPDARRPRFLAVAAAVVVVLAMAGAAFALTGGDDNESVTMAGPDGDPVHPHPSCEDITRFADALDDTGIDYDQQPSFSPQDLADQSDAVFAGTLTGTVTQARDEEYRMEYVGFEVEVADRFKSDGERTSDTVTVLLADGIQRPSDYWADLTAAGAPVLVFADAPPGSIPDAGTSVVANGVEGIVTGCEDGPPLGLVGTQGDWPTFMTLADVTDALGPSTADIESQVAVPENGASAQQLADGTPVWVVRHDDGTVSVVHAVSTHRPFGAGTLVGWCGSSRSFIDPMYGSQFDERGRSHAGPAPRGLDMYPVASVDGDTAAVTGPPVVQPRAAEGGPEPSEPAGPDCLDETSGPVDGYLSGSFDLHPFASETPVSPDDAVRQPDGTFVLVDAPLVIVEGDQPLACTSDVGGSPPACGGVPAPELFVVNETAAVLRGPFLARPEAGTLTDIAYVGERTVTYYDAPAVEGDTAVWDVNPANPPAPSDTSVTAMVTRLGCSGGETGEVLEPEVSADDRRVVLTFSVEPLPEGEYTCPGNPAVPYVVELDEPVGDRELVDGACLSGDAASTSHCSDGAVRWPDPA